MKSRNINLIAAFAWSAQSLTPWPANRRARSYPSSLLDWQTSGSSSCNERSAASLRQESLRQPKRSAQLQVAANLGQVDDAAVNPLISAN
jgi:hypothetical protein